MICHSNLRRIRGTLKNELDFNGNVLYINVKECHYGGEIKSVCLSVSKSLAVINCVSCMKL